ncbi:sulfite oxidase [Sphaerisporangium sp. TRM90804]|uniref:sulfite oxidase n=1 Tax=Sphaerisporangium sp. TRM90804 TaxID=3031113 RepID=UPI00244C4677|nr:sulfite oxidase [Sphaerisporangium sp. TRM90804]MDH2430347.1 sulfite oxidase [Sphaerisporangium sp. TRM90804]
MNAWGKRDDMVVHNDHPFNAEPPPAALAGRPITPVDTFYARNHGPVPESDPEGWCLVVDGLVERPLTLSVAHLRALFPEQTVVATLQCAGNRRAGLAGVRDIPGEPWGRGATSTASWTGVGLAGVLEHAGLRPEAAHIAFEAPDVSQEPSPPQAYGGSIPVAKAMAGEVLLAWAMNGEPLPPAHGAPLRVVVPGWIGARSVKWLRRVTAQSGPSGNYYQAVAYRILPPGVDPDHAGPGEGISLGPVALSSAILSPADGARLAPGPAEVTGYAYAGDGRAVARVDVSLDDGATWAQAALDPQDDGPWAWQHWRLTVDLPEGDSVIAVRAWDDAAETQPESPAQVWNPKGYANTSWDRVAVTCDA